MKKIIHKSENRGYANHGWLKAKHSFSFAGWYDPEKINFGKLRVLNDDIIAGGGGFDTHPHDNMEIVTIPLTGKLAHKDSEGNEEVIHPNEVQVMSAGTGILHSEYNASQVDDCNLFQTWIFPDKKGHQPRYDQKMFDPKERKNKLQYLVSPDQSEGNLWLNQNAYFSRSDLDSDISLTYELHSKGNGVYIMILDGEIEVAGENLSSRDAIGLWELDSIEIKSTTNSEILIIEIPMD